MKGFDEVARFAMAPGKDLRRESGSGNEPEISDRRHDRGCDTEFTRRDRAHERDVIWRLKKPGGKADRK